MNKVMFGVIMEDFKREYLSGSDLLHTVHQYQGQILLSDGKYSKPLDDFEVQSLNTTYDKCFPLLQEHFDEELNRNKIREKKYLSLNYPYVHDNLSWLTNLERYPIKWFESFQDAYSCYKQAPIKRTIASSNPVKIQ